MKHIIGEGKSRTWESLSNVIQNLSKAYELLQNALLELPDLLTKLHLPSFHLSPIDPSDLLRICHPLITDGPFEGFFTLSLTFAPFTDVKVFLHTMISLLSFFSQMTSVFKLETKQSEIFKQPDQCPRLRVSLTDEESEPTISKDEDAFVLTVS